eukprot:1154173-Pelagomonas_calceolata.AAC.6
MNTSLEAIMKYSGFTPWHDLSSSFKDKGFTPWHLHYLTTALPQICQQWHLCAKKSCRNSQQSTRPCAPFMHSRIASGNNLCAHLKRHDLINSMMLVFVAMQVDPERLTMCQGHAVMRGREGSEDEGLLSNFCRVVRCVRNVASTQTTLLPSTVPCRAEQ